MIIRMCQCAKTGIYLLDYVTAGNLIPRDLAGRDAPNVRSIHVA